jgi:hypothetical protein
MKTIKTIIFVSVLVGVCPSAVSYDPETTPIKTDKTPQEKVVQTESTQNDHDVKMPVLIDPNPYNSQGVDRRVTRVIYEPIETPIARDASMSTESQFVFKNGKNTNTKTFRPENTASASMPNKFKK